MNNKNNSISKNNLSAHMKTPQNNKVVLNEDAPNPVHIFKNLRQP